MLIWHRIRFGTGKVASKMAVVGRADLANEPDRVLGVERAAERGTRMENISVKAKMAEFIGAIGIAGLIS